MCPGLRIRFQSKENGLAELHPLRREKNIHLGRFGELSHQLG